MKLPHIMAYKLHGNIKNILILAEHIQENNFLVYEAMGDEKVVEHADLMG